MLVNVAAKTYRGTACIGSTKHRDTECEQIPDFIGHQVIEQRRALGVVPEKRCVARACSCRDFSNRDLIEWLLLEQPQQCPA
jgi:hypothetical protein